MRDLLKAATTFVGLLAGPRSPGVQSRFKCPWAPTDEAPRLNGTGGITESEPAADVARAFARCAQQSGTLP